MEDNQKKLYRSDTDKMLCGVCGGVAEYFNVDSTLIRLLWAVLACSGPGIVPILLRQSSFPEDKKRFSKAESRKKTGCSGPEFRCSPFFLKILE